MLGRASLSSLLGGSLQKATFARIAALGCLFAAFVACSPTGDRGGFPGGSEGSVGGASTGVGVGGGGDTSITPGASLVVEPAKAAVTVTSKNQPAMQSFKALLGESGTEV